MMSRNTTSRNADVGAVPELTTVLCKGECSARRMETTVRTVTSAFVIVVSTSGTMSAMWSTRPQTPTPADGSGR